MDSSIIIILIIAVMIVRAVPRSKERLRSLTEKVDESIPSTWGTLTQPEEEQPKQMPATRQTAPRPATRIHRQAEKPDAQTLHKLSAQPAEGGRLHAKPSAETLPEHGENNPAGEAFDLRRAVVYAEILKPKFDDD